MTGRPSLRRIAGVAIAMVALTVCAVIATGLVARRSLLKGNPPAGVLVDVGGYRMHINCTGVGAPTVVLEAGLLDFSVVWAKVQPALASSTRTCSYDRAGLGWSEASPRSRTSESMVTELHTLLAAARVPPPYVLVGHSFGGMNVSRFAERFPDEVAGVVLVDAAHEEQTMHIVELRTAAAALNAQFHTLSRLNAFGLLALAPTRIPDRDLPPATAKQYRAVLASAPYFDTAVQELQSLEESFRQRRTAHAREKREAPAVIISRGRTSPIPGVPDPQQARIESTWRALQQELAARFPHSSHIIAEKSAHDVHIEQPAVVVDAVRSLVGDARLRSPRGQ